MKEQFTQGEWSINVCEAIFGVSDFSTTEVVVGDYSVSGEVCNEHDAHLIAAAPKMYRMLQGMADATVHNYNYETAKPIYDLLAEARGEK